MKMVGGMESETGAGPPMFVTETTPGLSYWLARVAGLRFARSISVDLIGDL